MTSTDKLYQRIGQFLEDHRLVPDPAHYAFVHAILTQPNSSLAKAAAALIDGGVRLHQDDIQRLGGPTAGQRQAPPPAPPQPYTYLFLLRGRPVSDTYIDRWLSPVVF